MFQVCNKGSRYWGHRWATRTLFPPIWFPVDQCDEGVRHTAPLLLRSRASQCRAHKVRCFLGELGRLLAHGVCSRFAAHPLPQRSCRHHRDNSREWVVVPTWRELMLGARAPPREPDDYEPGSQRAGWLHEAASRVDRHFRDDVLFDEGSHQVSSWTYRRS